jgi:hypothetical protein
MPEAPTAVELLALLTRVRSTLVAAGQLHESRLYDLRAFKTAYAELGYLRRLAAAGRHGGTVVTSMRQLVAGLAALHPTWKRTGDPWEDRDRHHRAVRRRLSALAAAGLLRWRIGLDEDLEERRTELELQPIPELKPHELATAQDRLERWEARYGPELNTPSPSGIADVKRQARPLSAPERQRRGCAHARRAACSRRGSRARSILDPPSGAPPTSENNTPVVPSSHVPEPCDASGGRTGVTRARELGSATAPTAPNGRRTAAAKQKPQPAGDHEGSAEPEHRWRELVEQLSERVAAREAERAPVLAAVAEQVQERALEVASWGLERSWPAGWLREAWAAARWGLRAVADHGHAAAGRLAGEDYLRLRRAVARYERNATGAPQGFPAKGLAALLHIASLAGESGRGPRTLRYGIGALDQLSRRMRAHNTANSARRHAATVRRARARHRHTPAASRLEYRLPGVQWPPWVLLDKEGLPGLIDGELQVDPDYAPPTGSEAHRALWRDAWLVRGLTPPPSLDGRQAMHLRALGQLQLARRPERDHLLLELAARTGHPLAQLYELTPERRQRMLQDARTAARHDATARAEAFRERIADAAAATDSP